MSFEPEDWIAVARQEANRKRWRNRSIDADDIEGAILERFAAKNPPNEAYARTVAQTAALNFAQSWYHTTGREFVEETLELDEDTNREVVDHSSMIDTLTSVDLQLRDMPQRSVEIFSARLSGVSVRDLTVEYGLSDSRIRQLSEECRVRLSLTPGLRRTA